MIERTFQVVYGIFNVWVNLYLLRLPSFCGIVTQFIILTLPSFSLFRSTLATGCLSTGEASSRRPATPT